MSTTQRQRSVQHERDSNARPTPVDLPMFLSYACAHLQAPFIVHFQQVKEEYVTRNEKKPMLKAEYRQSTLTNVRYADPLVEPTGTPMTASRDSFDNNAIGVTAHTDAFGRVVELQFHPSTRVPRLLLQVITLCLPHQPQLRRLTARRVRLDAGALYELARLLPASNLTDISLDDSPDPGAHHHLLLERVTQLRRLSLDRCNLGDDGAASLAAALVQPRPASTVLQSLSLGSNGIGDEGAHALGLALRSNRALLHLNLAGNHLTDVGAAAVLETLCEFELTPDERLAGRRCMFEYHRSRREEYARVLASLAAKYSELQTGEAAPARSMTKRRAAASGRSRASIALSARLAHESLCLRAALQTDEAIGRPSSPFSDDYVVVRDGVVYSLGNLALCYLNLAYNELTYFSAVKLEAVLRHQAGVAASRSAGLVRVVVEGNPLPIYCGELLNVRLLLNKRLTVRNVESKLKLAPRRIEKGRDRYVTSKSKKVVT